MRGDEGRGGPPQARRRAEIRSARLGEKTDWLLAALSSPRRAAIASTRRVWPRHCSASDSPPPPPPPPSSPPSPSVSPPPSPASPPLLKVQPAAERLSASAARPPRPRPSHSAPPHQEPLLPPPRIPLPPSLPPPHCRPHRAAISASAPGSAASCPQAWRPPHHPRHRTCTQKGPGVCMQGDLLAAISAAATVERPSNDWSAGSNDEPAFQ